MMLEVDNVSAYYGKIRVLWDVSINVEKGEIVALIGANAAGKTTILDTISGFVRPAPGSVTFLGQRLDQMPPHDIVKLGISHIPEGGKAFPDMTVGENLDMGAYSDEAWGKKKETLQQVLQMFPLLEQRAKQLARTLSGGERQMLAIGRGLMSRPKLCALDEPSYGLSPLMVKEIFDAIRTLRDQGMTILLVEQDVQQSLEIADRAYVLENGRVALEGPSADLLQNDHVKKAYLGL
ncbi:MAG TPA: ABC transporter ATP-binding protein [Syntrophorhabdales bacterium]|nr:ABC transporter ATP-binding protein [Syntrophorhabdales bacterium]